MAKPRIFISSTFYDLKHIRSSLESFITSLGYEAILSEKGSIAYSPSTPLDESCYRDAQTSDVFVLIVGGRYGSEATGENTSSKKEFFERYKSITKKEYESAFEKNIPVYVLIEKLVYGEFETYRNNKDNKTINYVHADSVNVFHFIEDILNKPRNNPVHQFDHEAEIEIWLKSQWAGLFKEMINNQSEMQKISSLSDQVKELENINKTLKRYMEEIVENVLDNEEHAKEIINEEDKRLEDEKQLNLLSKLSSFKDLTEDYELNTNKIREIFIEATSLNDLLTKIEEESNGVLDAKKVLEFWKEHPDKIGHMNEVRNILDLDDLSFEEDISNK